jgi:hypothetical protein
MSSGDCRAAHRINGLDNNNNNNNNNNGIKRIFFLKTDSIETPVQRRKNLRHHVVIEIVFLYPYYLL